ncbi:hypothetical protein NDU88_008865 [Pleurodeles waltl]|uniref:Uncharacterized protein n=1 Tax=Pleurodeles waltl TaxID=8319 RepID=A0AAV7RTP0_PLEWA|nr:hypothetical protein NDU88_008865 [Pleurodeles waltl]
MGVLKKWSLEQGEQGEQEAGRDTRILKGGGPRMSTEEVEPGAGRAGRAGSRTGHKNPERGRTSQLGFAMTKYRSAVLPNRYLVIAISDCDILVFANYFEIGLLRRIYQIPISDSLGFAMTKYRSGVLPNRYLVIAISDCDILVFANYFEMGLLRRI